MSDSNTKRLPTITETLSIEDLMKACIAENYNILINNGLTSEKAEELTIKALYNTINKGIMNGFTRENNVRDIMARLLMLRCTQQSEQVINGNSNELKKWAKSFPGESMLWSVVRKYAGNKGYGRTSEKDIRVASETIVRLALSHTEKKNIDASLLNQESFCWTPHTFTIMPFGLFKQLNEEELLQLANLDLQYRATLKTRCNNDNEIKKLEAYINELVNKYQIVDKKAYIENVELIDIAAHLIPIQLMEVISSKQDDWKELKHHLYEYRNALQEQDEEEINEVLENLKKEIARLCAKHSLASETSTLKKIRGINS